MPSKEFLAALGAPLIPQSAKAQVELISLIRSELQLDPDSKSPSASCKAHVKEPLSTRTAGFRGWLAERGVQYSDLVEICEFDGKGLGLRTVKHLKKGDLCLVVPRSVMMTERDASRRCPLVKPFLKDPVISSMPGLRLGLYLHHERLKGRQSNWYPYIALLPHQFSTPLYFKDEEIKVLAGTGILPEVTRLFLNTARQFVHVNRLLPREHTMSWDDFRWAISVVMTRQNFIVTHDDDDKQEGDHCCNATLCGSNNQQLCLIPLWDLCNHSDGEITTFYDPERKESQSFAIADTDAGNELLISYGQRSNWELLIHNGFVDPRNTNVCLSISVPLTAMDWSKIRANLAAKLGISAGMPLKLFPAFPLTKHEGNWPVLLILYILLEIRDEDLESIGSNATEFLQKTTEQFMTGDLPNSILNWIRLKLAVYDRLHKISVEEYDKLIMATKNPNLILVLRYAQLEKRLISEMINLMGL